MSKTANPCMTAIVGYGRAGRELHYAALRGLFGADHPTLVVDPIRPTQLSPTTTWTPNISGAVAILERSGADPTTCVYHVTTPVEEHLPCIEELVLSGAHRLIVEKPLATTRAGVARIEELASGREILPVSIWLASKVTDLVEHLLGDGEIGELVSLHIEQSKPRFRRTLEHPDRGSAFEIELPHQILLALAIAGPVEQVVSSHSWPMRSGDGHDASTGGAHVEFEHASGVSSTLVTDLTAPVRVRRLRAIGTRGEIVADYPVSRDDDFGQVRLSGGQRRYVVADAPLSRFLQTAYDFLVGVGNDPPRGDLSLHALASDVIEQCRVAPTVVGVGDVELMWS